MGFLQEFKEFIRNILSWIYLLLGLAGFLFLFGIKEIEIFGKTYFLPLPSLSSFSVQFFEKTQQALLPAGVQLIVTNPLSAFLSQIMVSLSIAFLLTFPYFLWKIITYLSPALYENEKKAIFKILIPSLFLFTSGSLFAYFLLIPATFKILYAYAPAIGAIPFFSVSEFVTLIFGIMAVVGIMFLLPVFMVLLTRLGIVENVFWKRNWRYAILVSLIFSAIVTPDGTGITMAILSVPLFILYFLGMGITSKKSKIQNSKS